MAFFNSILVALMGFLLFGCTEEEQVKLAISSIQPDNAPIGASITISGVGFGDDIAQNTVKFFDGVSAIISNSSPTSLEVIVPEGALTGAITVTVNGMSTISKQDFVIAPTINDFTPGSGVVGTSVVITGSGFSPTNINNTVTFNNTPAIVEQASFTSLTVKVPGTGSNGKIKVQVGSLTATSDDDFIFIPKIQSLSPAVGAVNRVITIEGSGFNPVSAQNNVEFNGVSTPVLSGTTNTLVVAVPVGASSGNVTVTTSGNTASGPNFEVVVEAMHAGGSEFESGFSVAVDQTGNTYITGSFNDVATFGSTVLVPNGEDIFVAKYNNQAVLQWVKKIGGPGSDRGLSIVTDGAGYCYVGGWYGENAYLAQLDPDGNTMWSQTLGGNSTFHKLALQNDNLIASGSFEGSFLVGTTTITSVGESDILVCNFNRDTGTPIWVKTFGGDKSDAGMSVAFSSTGEMYVSGNTFSTMTVGTTTLSAMGGLDAFLLKLDSDGEPLWVEQLAGTDWESAVSVTVDNAENPVVTGYFTNSMTIGTTVVNGNGNEDMFLAKFSGINGSLVWVVKGGGTSYDQGSCVSSDNNGNLYVTGYYEFAATFGSQNIPNSTSSRDIFVAKYNGQGTIQWVKTAGANESDQGNSIAVGENGIVHVTGSFRDFPITLESTAIQNSGGDDMFVWKIWQP